jgi:hypothetical protein
MKTWIAAVLGILALATSADAAGTRTRTHRASPAARVPRYNHIFFIIDENKGYNQLMDMPAVTPVIHALAAQYGTATQFYAEVHPSEANYIAMLGGDTFAIHDDDAFYCTAGMKDPFCEDSGQPGYANHDIAARSLTDQLSAKGLTWKAYVESIPAAGSLVPRWPTADYPAPATPNELYAAKHNGFVNFSSPTLSSASGSSTRTWRPTRCPITRTSSPTSATTCTACPDPMSRPTARATR